MTRVELRSLVVRVWVAACTCALIAAGAVALPAQAVSAVAQPRSSAPDSDLQRLGDQLFGKQSSAQLKFNHKGTLTAKSQKNLKALVNNAENAQPGAIGVQPPVNRRVVTVQMQVNVPQVVTRGDVRPMNKKQWAKVVKQAKKLARGRAHTVERAIKKLKFPGKVLLAWSKTTDTVASQQTRTVQLLDYVSIIAYMRYQEGSYYVAQSGGVIPGAATRLVGGVRIPITNWVGDWDRAYHSNQLTLADFDNQLQYEIAAMVGGNPTTMNGTVNPRGLTIDLSADGYVTITGLAPGQNLGTVQLFGFGASLNTPVDWDSNHPRGFVWSIRLSRDRGYYLMPVPGVVASRALACSQPSGDECLDWGPQFGTPQPTGDGYTVQITNYGTVAGDLSTKVVAGSASNVTISNTGLVTVSGVPKNTDTTVDVTATKLVDDWGYYKGHASVTGKWEAPAQTVTFGSAPSVSVGATGTVHATSTGDGTITYTSDDTSACTVDATSGVVTGVSVGTNNCTITATAAATANWSAGHDSQTFSVACAAGQPCAVGDLGPGGGTVFYASAAGFTNTATGETVHYLEYAPDRWNGGYGDPMMEYGCYGAFLTGATGTAIGTGQANTRGILSNAASCTSAGYSPDAAIAADSYQGADGTTTGWFLPSSGELNQLCRYVGGLDPSSTASCYTTGTSRTLVPGFADTQYWSSTQTDTDHAANISPGNGFVGSDSKDSPDGSVRPIRAF